MPKIYCTKCGREIKNGLLYCDRCGQSVKKSMENQRPLKYRQIEEIHKERVNRKKRQEAEAAKRRTQKKKALRRTRIIVFLLFLLVLALICSVAAFFAMSKDSSMKDRDDLAAEDIASTPTPLATSEALTDASALTAISYTEFSDSGMTLSYPSYFTSVTAEGSEHLRLTDSAGGGVITISKNAQTGEGKDLLIAYMAGKNVIDNDAHAGSNWYDITFLQDAKICHRKLVVNNGAALYYDFSYDVSSSKAADYEKYIDEMDRLFKN